MPRKTTGNATTRINKKGGGSVQPASVQVAPEVPKNGKQGNSTPENVAVNLEEKIRVRAYELYLERRATAGDAKGDENQDRLVAEREILSRNDGQGHHSA
jgi:hypothetical protein